MSDPKRAVRGASLNPVVPAAVTVVEITDPTAVGESIDVLDQDVVQLEAKPLRAQRASVRLENSLVIYQSTNRRVRARTKLDDNVIAFLVIGENAEGTFDGMTMHPDLLIVVAPGHEAELIVDANYESIAFLIPPAEMEQQLGLRERHDELRLPQGAEIRKAGSGAARALFTAGKRVTETAAQFPEIFNDSHEARSSAQAELVEVLLAALVTGDLLQPTGRDHTRNAYSKIIKRATDHADSRPGERIYVSDLCLAANVSERTLQYAFQEIMDASPMAYLSRLRLHRARQALRAVADSSTSVSDIALDWGFWHFGEFSAAYKKCFGELPSETLKRRSVDS